MRGACAPGRWGSGRTLNALHGLAQLLHKRIAIVLLSGAGHQNHPLVHDAILAASAQDEIDENAHVVGVDVGVGAKGAALLGTEALEGADHLPVWQRQPNGRERDVAHLRRMVFVAELVVSRSTEN
eukprot:2659381-Prymnesium_polylepis.1